MTYKKVLLLTFPKFALDAPPLAPALLGAICEKHGVDYDFVDCNLEFTQRLSADLRQEILESFAEQFTDTLSEQAQAWVNGYFNNLVQKCQGVELVAISVFSFHSISIAAKFLKEHRQNFKADVVIGGAGVSSEFGAPGTKFYQWLKSNNLIDYWVLGEGDIAFEELLLNNTNSDSINNNTLNHLQDFSKVPTPNFDKYLLENYTVNNKRIISVEGSRGCVKKCTFCDIQNTWGRYKYKNGARLAEELLDLKEKYNVEHFWFNDSLINGSMKSFREFIKVLADKNPNGSKFTWSSQAIVRPKSLQDEEDFKLIKASGCETLAVGIESFSEQVRFHMGKKFTDDDLDWFLTLAQKYNITIFLLMIVGYPTETQADFEHTLSQLTKYNHLADDGTISGIRIGGTMSIHSGIPIYNMQEDLGIKFATNDMYKSISWFTPNNNIKDRVKWRVEIEDHARKLGYNCADPEMSIEQTLLRFLNTLNP